MDTTAHPDTPCSVAGLPSQRADGMKGQRMDGNPVVVRAEAVHRLRAALITDTGVAEALRWAFSAASEVRWEKALVPGQLGTFRPVLAAGELPR